MTWAEAVMWIGVAWAFAWASVKILDDSIEIEFREPKEEVEK